MDFCIRASAPKAFQYFALMSAHSNYFGNPQVSISTCTLFKSLSLRCEKPMTLHIYLHASLRACVTCLGARVHSIGAKSYSIRQRQEVTTALIFELLAFDCSIVVLVQHLGHINGHRSELVEGSERGRCSKVPKLNKASQKRFRQFTVLPAPSCVTHLFAAD